MANGQQKADENVKAFDAWKASLSDDDFKQIVYRGNIQRSEVAKAVGCGKSALTQNPALKAGLIKLEDDLRERGVLPPLNQAKKDEDRNAAKEYDNTIRKRSLESRRLSYLELENIELKAKVDDLEHQLKKKKAELSRYSEQSEALYELGTLP